MEIHELVVEMKYLERRLTLYEEKYGILSQDFYDALMTGQLAQYDDYDETRTDFSRWKGIHETWLRRKQAYSRQMQQHDLGCNFTLSAGLLKVADNPLKSLGGYSRFVAELLDRPTVKRSTVTIWPASPYTGIAEHV